PEYHSGRAKARLPTRAAVAFAARQPAYYVERTNGNGDGKCRCGCFGLFSAIIANGSIVLPAASPLMSLRPARLLVQRITAAIGAFPNRGGGLHRRDVAPGDHHILISEAPFPFRLALDGHHHRSDIGDQCIRSLDDGERIRDLVERRCHTFLLSGELLAVDR